MALIKCPKCGETFPITKSNYATILKQVRDQEFEKEITSYKEILDKEKAHAIHAAELNAEHAAQESIAKFNTTLARMDSRNRSQLLDLTEKYEDMLREKNNQIALYKDFKARQSTKMVGESLERHCESEFNKLRAAGFPNAYFEKDNDTRTGSKGDYIFKEADADGTEIITIMFEMKNECDVTASKKKNEDFFKELDKDRREKKCEYAVLVSLLELDNDFYNTGIADVSYRYPKMYVIRPQCFISMITVLRNAALNSVKYKKELIRAKKRDIDLTSFEQEIEEFKVKFSNNFRLASDKFANAIDEIDKTITHLQKVKEDLLSSERNLRLANQKAQDLSLERIAKKTSKRKGKSNVQPTKH